ncbi:hypothetical protein DFS34DRAFT_387734 [Phlyctochytrium arcticum]|nr:hypothetical protein DFS34DRAFT_387734 [Phlyctochytrium arcticum]
MDDYSLEPPRVPPRDTNQEHVPQSHTSPYDPAPQGTAMEQIHQEVPPSPGSSHGSLMSLPDSPQYSHGSAEDPSLNFAADGAEDDQLSPIASQPSSALSNFIEDQSYYEANDENSLLQRVGMADNFNSQSNQTYNDVPDTRRILVSSPVEETSSNRNQLAAPFTHDEADRAVNDRSSPHQLRVQSSPNLNGNVSPRLPPKDAFIPQPGTGGLPEHTIAKAKSFDDARNVLPNSSPSMLSQPAGSPTPHHHGLPDQFGSYVTRTPSQLHYTGHFTRPPPGAPFHSAPPEGLPRPPPPYGYPMGPYPPPRFPPGSMPPGPPPGSHMYSHGTMPPPPAGMYAHLSTFPRGGPPPPHFPHHTMNHPARPPSMPHPSSGPLHSHIARHPSISQPYFGPPNTQGGRPIFYGGPCGPPGPPGPPGGMGHLRPGQPGAPGHFQGRPLPRPPHSPHMRPSVSGQGPLPLHPHASPNFMPTPQPLPPPHSSPGGSLSAAPPADSHLTRSSFESHRSDVDDLARQLGSTELSPQESPQQMSTNRSSDDSSNHVELASRPTFKKFTLARKPSRRAAAADHRSSVMKVSFEQTMAMYRENALKSDDARLKFEFAKFCIEESDKATDPKTNETVSFWTHILL